MALLYYYSIYWRLGWQLTKGWRVQVSNPGEGEILRVVKAGPEAFPRVKAARA